MSTDILKNAGIVRTDLHCHSCEDQGKPSHFSAAIDFDLDGNHEIECPRCAHIHYRKIKNGRVTSDRYSSDGSATHKVDRRNMWKHATQPIVTSTASAFIRDRLLNKEY